MSRVVVLRDTPAEPLGDHVLWLRDRGHEVHLVAPGDEMEHAPDVVDDVRVTTAPVDRWLAPGSQVARSPRWTRPFSYRLLMKASTRKAVAEGHVRQAEFERDVAVVRAGRVPLPVRSRLFLARLERRWVARRAADTREAYDIRRGRRRRLDELARRWWRLTSRDHAWARLAPGLLDVEVQLGPILDQIEADVIHAEGAVMMSVAVRSAARRHGHVTVVWDRTDEFTPKRPWLAEARGLLLAEYAHRVDHTLAERSSDALASVYEAAGLHPMNPHHREGTP